MAPQLFDFSATKIDELDQKFSGTLAEQAQRIEALMAQMARHTATPHPTLPRTHRCVVAM